MENQKMDRFLAQFEISRKNVDEWPKWMKDVAKVATASFPENKQTKGDVKSKPTHKK